MKTKSHDLASTPAMESPHFRRNLRRWILAANHLLTLLIVLPLFLGSAASLSYLAWKTPQWFGSAKSIVDVKERLNLENEILRNLFQVVGGTFLLAGLYFTWRNLNLAKEGQVTDRFNKAIEHLGDEKLEV